MSIPHRDIHIRRQSLIHVTPVNCADLIIESQRFKTGNGLYGVGVYFANTLEAAFLKVKHHKGRIRWAFLIADVYIGKAISYSKKEATSINIDTQALIKQGYSTIIGFKQPTGREIVCLNPNRIHNIKYIYGQKPSKFLLIDRPRIVLFYVTDVSKAGEVHDTQKINQSNGPFGRGYYLYYTLTDAIKLNPNAETYFACDAYLTDFHQLEGNENLNSKHIRKSNLQSFKGRKNGIYYYIFKNPKLIVNIHFCGGKPWNK